MIVLTWSKYLPNVSKLSFEKHHFDIGNPVVLDQMGFVLWFWVTEEQREYIRNIQVKSSFKIFFVCVEHETTYRKSRVLTRLV